MRIVEEDIKNLILWREKKDKNALNKLVDNNIGLVIFFANIYANRFLYGGLTFEELKSAGIEGLIKAINHYDYTDDTNAFSTYIGLSIRRAIAREIDKYNKHSHVLSLDQKISRNEEDESLRIEDVVGTDSEEVSNTAMSSIKSDIIKEVLSCLTPKEQEVIILRYGLNGEEKNLVEIAEMLNCTKQSIFKNEKNALLKLSKQKSIKKLKDFIE